MRCLKSLLLSILISLSWNTSIIAQERLEHNFEFPETEMGAFAKAWFKAANSAKPDLLTDYNLKEDGWEDYFKSITALVKRVGGISPKMLSYQTDRSISIYTLETSGQWVLVNLGLDAKNSITAMGIKKSFMPNNYGLENGISPAQVHELIKAIGREFRKNYVVKERRTDLEQFLLNKLDSGKYDAISQCDLLAITLSKDLVSFANDKHLQIIPPSRLSEVKVRFGAEDAEEIAEEGVHLASNEQLEERLPISGEILENGVGYIQLERFVDSKRVIRETDRIMEELKATKAVIIDLRQSGGGDGAAVNNLLSYFFARGEALDQGKAFQKSLSMMYKDKPLYVLTSKRSISAAEGFAYFLQQRKRATLIGQTTAGAGYLVDAYQLPFDFYLVNSIATNFDLSKREGWQGRGVKPDIETSRGKALEKALSLIK